MFEINTRNVDIRLASVHSLLYDYIYVFRLSSRGKTIASGDMIHVWYTRVHSPGGRRIDNKPPLTPRGLTVHHGTVLNGRLHTVQEICYLLNEIVTGEGIVIPNGARYRSENRRAIS